MGSAARALGVSLDDTDNDPYRWNRVRQQAPNDQLTQDLAAPLEHQQFMQETTARNPAVGTAAMVGAPFYTGAKAISETPDIGTPGQRLFRMAAKVLVNSSGTGETKTSNASDDELFAAGRGYLKGMKQWLKK